VPAAARTGRVGRSKSCHERALGLLAVRSRSRRELRDRLTRAGFEAGEVDDTLERLEAVGLVDDERFAQEFARHQRAVRKAGNRAVASGLLAKGVPREIVERTLVQDATESEDARAEGLARARAARLPRDRPAAAHQRLTSFLLRRGYPPETARRAARVALGGDRGEE
jgi:regulatory protein